MTTVVERLHGGLIVSCQAPVGSPLRSATTMAAMAEAAEMGGAAGIRANGAEDIRAIRERSSLPIIGLAKADGGRRPIITPTPEAAMELVEAGADIVAVDATVESGGPGLELFARVRAAVEVPVMADVSTFAEGIRAADLGADVIGTTLSGYTPSSPPAGPGPDLDLVADLARRGFAVFAEGRVRTPEELRAAFAAGAVAVVVGGAITNPVETTARFASAIP